MQAVEAEYRDNPYHNVAHAADVVQTLGSMLLSEGFRDSLTAMEVLAMLVAAACHDVGHPGPHRPLLDRMPFLELGQGEGQVPPVRGRVCALSHLRA